MKKITLFLTMLGFFLTANAQYVFSPITGPTNVPQAAPVTINLNDVANAVGVPASSTGSYNSFSVSADWVAGGGGPWSSEADLTFTTTAGSITIDPPSTGGANSGNATTFTFEGDLAATYDPTTDGYIDIVLNQSWGGSDADWSNIVVTLFESPTCVVPTGMTTANLTTTSVDLTWAAGGTETTWNVEYNGGADFTPGNGEEEGSATVNTTPANSLSGLTPFTNYFVYYQADCAGNGLSQWVGPFTFLTGYCESIPTSNDGQGITAATLGAQSFTSGGDITYEDFRNPIVDLAAGVTSNFQITFATGFGYDVNVWIDFNNDLVFDNVTELVFSGETTNVNPSVFDASFLMPNVPLGVYNMRMGSADFGQATPDPCYSGSWGVTADFTVNVTTPPSCIPPSGITVAGITDTEAEISWTANNGETQWEIVIQPVGTGVPSGSGTLTSDNPYQAMGLNPSTSYEVYVRAVCSVGDLSVWSGPLNFTTNNAPPPPPNGVICATGSSLYVYTAEFDSFDGWTGDLTTTDQNGFWEIPNDSGSGNTGADAAFSGNGFMNYEASGSTTATASAVSPAINLTTATDGAELSFYMHAFGEDMGTLNIGVSTSPTGPFTNVYSWIGEYQTTGDQAWVPIGVNLDAYLGQLIYIEFSHTGTGGFEGDMSIDFMRVEACGDFCANPEATYTVIDDCDNGDQFLIDVNVTDMGDATSLTISNNIDATTVTANSTGVYQVGPFPFLIDVIITTTNDQDNACSINSEAIQLLACPPDNDNCVGAITAVVNNDDTCTQLTPGTILAATPSGVPNGSCAGDPNDDVWYEFTALNDVQVISIVNITGGTTNIDHALYEGSCGTLTELSCTNGTSSITPALVVGNTYYIRIFSGGSDNDESTTFDLCIRKAPSNLICENAENFCSVGGALTSSNIFGIPSSGDVACLGSIPNPTWNIIQIGTGGLIEIEINQTDDSGGGLDVDFVLWGPFVSIDQACNDIVMADCPTCPFSNNPDNGFYPFGNIVDCSYSGAATENLTIDNAIPGEIYMLLVTNFSNDPGSITIEQTNTSGTGNGTIEAEISVELTSNEAVVENTPEVRFGFNVDKIEVCGFPSVTIEADSPFADTYVWYKDGFAISGETSPTLVVTESNNYQVIAYDDQCGDDATSQYLDVFIYNESPTIVAQNITLCDGPESDGSEDFDLDALTTTLGLGTDFTVSYYTTTNDANQAINAVASPYASTGETLIIRIEDTNASNNNYLGCRQLSQVELVVNAMPVVNQPTDLEACSATGFAAFNLTDNDAEVLNGLNAADYTITYHASMADADTNTSALVSPYTNTSSPQTIYVRLEDNATNCYNTTMFNLVVNAPTQVAFSENISECDDNDGVLDDSASFDLNAHTTVVLGTQDPVNYNVTYHTSQSDADAGINPISSPYSSNGEVIYVRVEDTTATDCYVVNSFDLVLLEEPLATIDTDVFYYDNDTDEFLLCSQTETSIQLSIVLQGFTTNEVTIQWLLDNVELTGETSTTLNAESEGEYSAVITLNSSGCTYTVSSIDVLEIDNCVIPQGISPGLVDGKNDAFDLRYYDVTRLEIFNRNGLLVYSKDAYTNEWVGQTNDGEELPVGTYFYTLVYEGGTKTRSGWIYINR